MKSEGFTQLAPLAMHTAFSVRSRMQYAVEELMKELALPLEEQVIKMVEKDAVLHILKKGSVQRDDLDKLICELDECPFNELSTNVIFKKFDDAYAAIENADTLKGHMMNVVSEIHHRHKMAKIQEDIPDFLKAVVFHHMNQEQRDEE